MAKVEREKREYNVYEYFNMNMVLRRTYRICFKKI
jgi:hypothetical protein